MKKTLLLVAAISSATIMSAQSGEITSNRGENWLSESGDWGLTIDANPLLDYAGNIFNGTQDNTFNGFQYPNSMFAIQGKKLIDSETAYRGMVRLGFGSNKTTSKTLDLSPDALAAGDGATVENTVTDSYNAITLGAGLEKRIGSTRVVGVYGAMFMVSLGGSKTAYEYGNSNKDEFDNTGNSVRVTEEKDGSTFGVGLNAFGGVEWFCAPKMSLSGEYMWGLGLASTGFGEVTADTYDSTDEEVSSETVIGGNSNKENSFSLDTGISSFNIGVNFYFQ